MQSIINKNIKTKREVYFIHREKLDFKFCSLLNFKFNKVPMDTAQNEFKRGGFVTKKAS